MHVTALTFRPRLSCVVPMLFLCLLPVMAMAQFAPDPSVGRNLPDSIPESAPDAFARRPSELQLKPDYTDVPVIGNPGSGVLRQIIFSGAITPKDRSDGECIFPGLNVDRVDLLQKDRRLLSTLKEKYLNKSFDLQTVKEISSAMLHFYFHHEHPLVFVQPVSIDYEHGVLRIAVVEATLGQKVSTGSKWFSKGLLLRSLRARVGQYINRVGLLNDVAILNQNPFMQNQAVLKRGDLPGTTTIDLRTEDTFPMRGYVSVDNTGTEQTGPWRWSAGINWGNAFFQGAQLSYQYSAPFENINAQPVQSGSFSVPLPWKHIFAVYGSYSSTDVNINTGTTSIADVGTQSQISPRYIIPIGKMYGKLLQNITLGFDWVSSNLNYVQGGDQVPANQTDVIQAMAGYQALLKDKYGQTSISTDNYWSPGGLDSKNSTEAVQYVDSRTQANYYYSVLSLQRQNVLPYGCSLLALFSGQLASTSLISNEQLSIGGYGSVRGYPQQILYGDQGFYFNLELHSPSYSIFGLTRSLKNTGLDGVPSFLKKLGKDELMFLAFWDYGMVNSIQPLPGDPASYAITAVGIGVRYGIGSNYSLRCDLGFPMINPNVGVAIGPSINLGASIGF